MAESHTYLNCVHSIIMIVIMPLLLITINRERGKEVRAGTEKYVLSESEMELIVNE